MNGLPARPRTIDDLAAIVREAYSAGTPIVVTGSNSHDPRCLRPENAREISTLRLNHATNTADGLVTVHGGITLGALQNHLAWKSCWLPMDPPARNGRVPSQRTLGGLITTDSLGPLRLMHYPANTWANLIVSMKVIDVAGEIHAVESLRAYQEGARCTIAEVTLRVSPRPEDERCLLFFCDTPRIAQQLANQLFIQTSNSLAYLEAVGGRTFATNTLQLPTQKQGIILIAGTIGAMEQCEGWVAEARKLGASLDIEMLSQTSAQAGRLRLWLTTEPLLEDPDQIAACNYRHLHVLPQNACERLHEEEKLARQERRPFWAVCELPAGIMRIATI